MVYFEAWWVLGSHAHVTRCMHRRSDDADGAFIWYSVERHTVSGMQELPSSVKEKLPPDTCAEALSATVSQATHTRSVDRVPSVIRPWPTAQVPHSVHAACPETAANCPVAHSLHLVCRRSSWW